MTKNIFLVIVVAFFLFNTSIQAQILEDFSDGNFTNNPTWTGDDSLFKISTYSSSTWSQQPRLQLNATDAGVAHLCFENQLASLDSAEWRFWTRISLSSGTSTTNNLRYYLASDSPNLKGSLNGYFVMFGDDNDGAKDSVYLYKQDGNILTKLIFGNVTSITSSRNISVKVTRSQSGLWTLATDSMGGQNYVNEGSSIIDNSFQTGGYSGVYCNFTSSNKTNFYFDDIYVGPIYKDLIPPSLVSVTPIASNKISVEFSESLKAQIALNTVNYVVDQSVGSPITASFDPVSPLTVQLEFLNDFTPNSLYHLNISNIQDLAGNEMETMNVPFSFYTSSTWDLLIHEIMADPDPVVGLPSAEYIELYNNTNLPINLNGWILQVGSSSRILPSFILDAGGFVIITALANSDALSTYGNVIAVSSLQITNSGQEITLLSPENDVIHTVEFLDSWYKNEVKKAGGWSLEMIDSSNPCAGISNWVASVDSKGGTPGAQNSVYGSNPDVMNPALSSVVALGNNTLRIFFSERMDAQRLENLNAFQVDHNIGYPVSVQLNMPLNKFIDLVFEEDFVQNTIYTLSIVDTLTDCVGNMILLNSQLIFAMPTQAEEGDLVINEILSNPPSGGVDYVEIYNRSDKYIDLSNLKLGSITSSTQLVDIAPDGYVVFPKEYILLSSNTDAVKTNYTTYSEKNFIQMSSFPSYNNDEGKVLIQNVSGVNIDYIEYNVSMHYPLLRTTKGVSYERINPDRPSMEASNWFSASSSVGYGTPGYKNSQFSDFIAVDELFTIEPEIFTPDNDGVDDLLFIHYILPESGYRTNIWIYSSAGHRVKQLVNNDLLSTEGSIIWDGTSEDNLRSPAGIYVIAIELWNIKGEVKRYKKTATLGVRFK
ncbi:MAG: lamin tail domain-containing protein [Bacteroidales bacterium]|nr:lamin tail domain-containing protein [Bacteroidales bacterium]